MPPVLAVAVAQKSTLRIHDGADGHVLGEATVHEDAIERRILVSRVVHVFACVLT